MALEDGDRYPLAGLKERLSRRVAVGVAKEWAARISGGHGRLPIRCGLTGPELLSGGNHRFAATGNWA
jgi:hypothetical protein